MPFDHQDGAWLPCKQPLEGKVAVVTGANRTLGLETALALATQGAEVVITCRSATSGEAAAAEIRKDVPGAKIEVEELDLQSQDSVRCFAEAFKNSGRPLHIFVANAGANISSERKTADGVPLQCQVNYLGHYTLIRLLEPVLIASAPARVVSVSSVTHRLYAIRSPAEFLSRKECARYGHTKLAQVYFTYELQRRMGHLGVQASAVDPGGVRSNIWKGTFARPPISWYIKLFLAPPWDGAKAVVHAATTDYNRQAAPKSRWPEADRQRHLRFYAKGAFSWPLLTWYEGPKLGWLGRLPLWLQYFNVFLASALDWPLRKFSQGRLLARPVRCLSTRQSYNPKAARDLWELSAEIAQVPSEVQLPKSGLSTTKQKFPPGVGSKAVHVHSETF